MARPSETGSRPTGQAPSGLDASRFDPARVERAMRHLDEVMDEPITEGWEAHLKRCVLTVLQGYGQ